MDPNNCVIKRLWCIYVCFSGHWVCEKRKKLVSARLYVDQQGKPEKIQISPCIHAIRSKFLYADKTDSNQTAKQHKPKVRFLILRYILCLRSL